MKTGRKSKIEAKRLYQLCLVHDALDEDRVRTVVSLVLASGHRDRTGVLSHFLRRVKSYGSRHTATVLTAVPLTGTARETLQAGLVRRYGEGIGMDIVHVPELIGGFRVQVGYDVFDGTVRARLESLRDCFNAR